MCPNLVESLHLSVMFGIYHLCHVCELYLSFEVFICMFARRTAVGHYRHKHTHFTVSQHCAKWKTVSNITSRLSLSLSQASDDESYVSDVSDNISEDNASVTDNVSRQSKIVSLLLALFCSLEQGASWWDTWPLHTQTRIHPHELKDKCSLRYLVYSI